MDIFSSVHGVHLLLLLVQKGPWSEIFNKGDKVPWDRFFWRNWCLVILLLLPLSISHSLCHVLLLRLTCPAPVLHCGSGNLLVFSPVLQAVSGCWPPRLAVTDPPYLAPADTRTLGAKHAKKDFGLCMSLPPQPSTAAPLPSYLLVHGILLTG